MAVLIEEFLFSKLSDDAGVSGIVANRVYPDGTENIQESPYITYRTAHSQSVRSLSGPSGLEAPVIDIFCYSKKPKESKTLGGKVKDCLQPFVGTVAGVTVHDIRLLTWKDTFDENIKMHCRWLVFEIWHAA